MPWSRPTLPLTERLSGFRALGCEARCTQGSSCSVLDRPLRSSPLLVAPPPPGLAGSSCSPVAPRSPPVLGARSSIFALVAIARRPSPARPRRLQLLARRPPLAAGLIGSGCMHPRPPPASKSPASKSSAVRCPAAPPIVPRCPCLLPPTARPAARHRRAFCAYSREELVNALPHLRTRADAGGARTVEACQG